MCLAESRKEKLFGCREDLLQSLMWISASTIPRITSISASIRACCCRLPTGNTRAPVFPGGACCWVMKEEACPTAGSGSGRGLDPLRPLRGQLPHLQVTSSPQENLNPASARYTPTRYRSRANSDHWPLNTDTLPHRDTERHQKRFLLMGADVQPRTPQDHGTASPPRCAGGGPPRDTSKNTGTVRVHWANRTSASSGAD